MKKVLVVLAEGFEEMEAVISIDMLKRTGLDVKTVAVGKSDVVKASRGVKVQCDIKISEIKELPDAVVLPGGMPGAENLAKSGKVNDLIKNVYENGNLIASICASPVVVLAPTGILNGKKATCYPGFEKDFDSSIEYIDKNVVVVDGNIITSKGPGTAFYFALEIIKYLMGEEKANTVRKQALI